MEGNISSLTILAFSSKLSVMIPLPFDILYLGLALVFGLFILLIPPVIEVSILLRRIEIVMWPHYAAWGIFWIVAGGWLVGEVSTPQYYFLRDRFLFYYPVIALFAQLNYHRFQGRKTPLFIIFGAWLDE